MTSDSCDDSGDSEEEEEEEEEEEMDLDGMAPTSKRRKFAQRRALHASLHSGHYPHFLGASGGLSRKI